MLQYTRRIAATTIATFLFGALLAASGSAAWTPPETLTGTQLNTTCKTFYDPKGEPMTAFNYSASGNATGQVTGTFTAKGMLWLGPAGQIWLYGNDFTITTTKGLPLKITGSFDSPAAGFQAKCGYVNGNVTFKVDTLLGLAPPGTGPASLQINWPGANGGTIKYLLVMQ